MNSTSHISSVAALIEEPIPVWRFNSCLQQLLNRFYTEVLLTNWSDANSADSDCSTSQATTFLLQISTTR